MKPEVLCIGGMCLLFMIFPIIMMSPFPYGGLAYGVCSVVGLLMVIEGGLRLAKDLPQKEVPPSPKRRLYLVKG